ncbi:MAG: nucleotidyl transferase AbiEii/AbiGii toxin family protein [Deltaproteobacteria bacterium]|nr:nucleotidyl transferase AbiEii/AbiGii toxin family protein [Deltaproteobacteria bacterium]MBW1728766.1 nucleotidyl transferase AbiEii/AbiGii toxin family protein [Deltaproteobacteria bacterium]MBW1910090.1 nucleotidyl transferase AbiEii/AbiGii toxin family protein [Deltaproteobacteria bacterium]MBW2035432.1 nucleotidyl transferase AbiEii/AbiGii toxin family protein [Deltaproteobacteria bacterium]MBW2114805.1 nucleotidyl transferase AbiEii/AbiGii toxin family protein [Deltaproteobacteria bact
MSKQLIDLSGKIDSFLLEIFKEITKVSQTLSIDFFVVGATARDIILEFGYGIPTIRATRDIDFGVQVSNWEEFSRLKEGLIKTGNFTSTKETQRLKYENVLPVDIIPFGKIANQKELFTWPPEHEMEMNVLGFDESYEHSILVRLNTDPLLELRFVSLAGLAILKIIAWKDKYPLRKSDAKDLLLLIRNYLAAGNENRLYNEESDIMVDDFDYERASARLLGRDMAAISYPKTLEAIIEILNQETGDQSHYRLIENMRDIKNLQNDFEEILQLLEHLKIGVLERYKKV